MSYFCLVVGIRYKFVRDMGIGYNLGNVFDIYDLLKEINTPEEQIALNGNTFPKKMIKKIKINKKMILKQFASWLHGYYLLKIKEM